MQLFFYFTPLHYNRYNSTDEKPTNQSRLNRYKREYPCLNRKPQKARKNGESYESPGFTLKFPTYYDTIYLLDYIH